MVRVTARGVLAEVIKLEARWDIADQNTIGDAMCRILSVEIELAISVAIDESAPKPTPAVWLRTDLVPEAIRKARIPKVHH
jgi:hypothetical protein